MTDAGAASLENPIDSLTEVRPSATHGMGVFAKTRIPAGTVWWRARAGDVLLIRRDQYEALTASEQAGIEGLLDAILTYSYYVEALDALVLPLDNCRYVNHSFQPNSAELPDKSTPGSRALRDIEPGEEIFEDYAAYDECPWIEWREDFL